jgi:GntR family transcriptional regulator / MocR family aminotransferase
MAKESSTLSLNLRGPRPRMALYRWLYEELRTAILAGRLRPGARLPATRDLAAEYGISRPTIVTAFEQLRSEGYVEGKVGSGTYVSKTLPDEMLQAPRAKSAAGARRRCLDPNRGRHGPFARINQRSMLFRLTFGRK